MQRIRRVFAKPGNFMSLAVWWKNKIKAFHLPMDIVCFATKRPLELVGFAKSCRNKICRAKPSSLIGRVLAKPNKNITSANGVSSFCHHMANGVTMFCDHRNTRIHQKIPNVEDITSFYHRNVMSLFDVCVCQGYIYKSMMTCMGFPL